MLERPDLRTREALDLDRLLGILAARTRTAHGKERILELEPLPSADALERGARVTECRVRMDQGAGGIAMPATDPRTWLARLDEGAARLDLPEMRDVAQCLEASESARIELSGCDPEVFPRLHARGRGWPELEPALNLFRRTLGPDGEIRDDATQELRRIRRLLAELDNDLRRTVDKLLKSLGPYLAEQFVTLRHDRYVFPVRAEHHRKVQGLLHDQSNTGGTFFVEPFAVVELNNRRSEARLEEQAEVDRILRGITSRLREELVALRRMESLQAEMDFLEGLARTSRKWDARAAEASPGAQARLMDARHPLLMEQRGGAESVVPLSVELLDTRPGLLITGPNMGGKTVILKTVGLLVFLASCGAHIPAAEGSAVGEFDSLWADIGDAQSLERDMSTFAAHLLRLDQILGAAGPGSLVLCDELGTGTDPAEGGALSRAFLEGLRRKGARVLATSHLGSLKAYAGGDSGYENASMEFEPETFRPTYRLRLGVPGQSHALEMARRLHCLEPVLDRARELISPDERDSSRLVAELGRLAEAHEKVLGESRASAERADQLRGELDRRIGGWEKEKERLRAEARAEMEALVDGAERWVDDLKEAARTQNREAMREARLRLEEGLKRLDRPTGPQGAVPDLRAGDRAKLGRLSATVEVLEGPGPDGKVWVLNRGLKIQVHGSELEPVEGRPLVSVPLRGTHLSGDRPACTEVDLRGLTVMEAEQAVEKALDDAILTGVGEIRIIHGKGTGALRKAVQELLKSSSLVKAQRLGNWNEGGTGVTVVDLDS